MGDSVAKYTVASLLTSHLKSLSDRREIRVAGTTTSIKELFHSIEKVIDHEIDVTYRDLEWSKKYEQEMLQAGKKTEWKNVSVQRSVGFGGAELKDVLNGEYAEVKPKGWEDVVRLFST